MIVLGIHDGHNSSACIFINGKLKAAVAEERLSRQKHEYGYPRRAIQACLNIAGIKIKDINRVGVSTLKLPPMYFMTRRNANFDISDFWREQREYWYPRLYEGKSPSFTKIFSDKVDLDAMPYDWSLVKDENDSDGMLTARLKLISEELSIDESYISVHDHHTCHAYYGYYTYPNREDPLLVYTMDGGGDGCNGSVWEFLPGQKPRELSRSANCNIGRMYRYTTLILGMRPTDHEFKVMGLAAYSTKNTSHFAEDAYNIFAETLQVDGLGFRYNIEPKDNFFYFKEKLEGQRFDNIAYAIQRRTEELLTEWVLNGINQQKIPNVALSGGVSQNVKANKKIMELDEIDNLFVPPATGDESQSIGAGFIESLNHQKAADIPPMAHAYLGTSFTDTEVSAALEANEENYIVREATPKDVAQLMVDGEVVARFSTDHMEFGPRSLGNRSIIADPRIPEVVHFINKAVKMRDFWMPFAPSVLSERANEYLINPKGVDGRFMTIGMDSTAIGQKHLNAGLHAFDRSARPQIVVQADNPGYHELISAFEHLTGVGAVLNTSFNIHGEPIVESPIDALSTLRRSGLKHLSIGRWLVSKRN